MLNELEGVALGFVFRSAPCAAYQVRQLIKSSPSTHWQGSAGSIYPLLERLERDGLITAKSDESDGRARRELTVTSAGKKALKAWVKAGARADLVARVSDPVRTRLFFFDALTRKEQKALAEDMVSQLEAFLETSEEVSRVMRDASLPDQLGAKAATLTNRARVQLMKDVVKALSD